MLGFVALALDSVFARVPVVNYARVFARSRSSTWLRHVIDTEKRMLFETRTKNPDPVTPVRTRPQRPLRLCLAIISVLS